MTIGPLTDSVKKIRKSFELTKNIFDKIKHRYKDLDITILSMGMSDDYEIAIQCGSNMIRIGRGIFGERNY